MKYEPSKEQQLISAAKTAQTKTHNSIFEIRKAIAELEAEEGKVTQANVIRKLEGKRSRKTVIRHWKTLYPKPINIQEKNAFQDPAVKPFHLWTNEELGIPTLRQEKCLNPNQSEALLFYYLREMREMRIRELQFSSSLH